jgi:hypothetical protein
MGKASRNLSWISRVNEQRDILDKACVLAMLACLVYIAVICVNLGGDPLVQAPQLDARENLELAQAFTAKQPIEEPFYRSLLYPAVLNLLAPAPLKPLLGALLGAVCHLMNGWLVFIILGNLVGGRTAPLMGSCLYALNPASLFYAAQLLDVTFATTLFLGGLALGLDGRGKWPRLLATGLLLGLSVAARPQFLPVALALPLLLILIPRARGLRPALLWLPLAALLLGQGALNYRLSGDFRVLPWQGAYNLWAANKPGATGLYFKQSVDVSGRGDHGNPTRAESIHLYGLAHPDEQPPYDIDAMNAYWRGKFIDHVVNNPLQVAGLWLYKAYAVANSFEQYNNLTFSFHKERIPLLRYNPLNWGILFILGTLGLLQLFRTQPRTALVLLLVILAYASTLILFFASARFRLPLVPLFAILAGGSIGWFQGILQERRRLALTAAVVALTATLAYSSFGGIRSTDTCVQDRLLMANANADLSRDAEAARWAREVLADQPDRAEALRIYAVSYFNMALTGDPAFTEFGDWRDQRNWVRQSPPTDPVQDAVLGVFRWQWGERERAVDIWRAIAASGNAASGLAIACLSATGEIPDQGEIPPLGAALTRLLQRNPTQLEP